MQTGDKPEPLTVATLPLFLFALSYTPKNQLCESLVSHRFGSSARGKDEPCILMQEAEGAVTPILKALL